MISHLKQLHWRSNVCYLGPLKHYEISFYCLPDKSIPLSVQARQTYLFPTQSFPLLFTGGIRGIHGAGWSFEKIINH